MVINKSVDRTLSIIAYLILSINVFNYIFKYENLADERKINFNSNWFFILMDIMIFIIVLLDFIIRRRKAELFKNITYKVIDSNRGQFFLLKIFIISVTLFNTYISLLYPSFIQLTGVFMMVLLVSQSTFHFLNESGLNENGICYGGNCYTWNEVKKCILSKNGDILRLTVRSKIAIFNINQHIDIKLKDNKDEILQLVNSKFQAI